MLGILIDRLADIDAVDDHGWTPLHYAAYAGYNDCIKMLLKNGADRRIKDAHHCIPLSIARYREEYFDKNPPLTQQEIFNHHKKNHNACVASLEDAKARMADIGLDDDEEDD